MIRFCLTLILLSEFVLSAFVEAKDLAPPASPPVSEWAFIKALSSQLTWNPHWSRNKKKQNEVDFRMGVSVKSTFPDSEGLLDTAYQDLQNFFKSVGVPANGPYQIITDQVPMKKFETFKLIVFENECHIQAGDTEGIRRGIFFLQDELLRSDGPFLTLGTKERSPFIRTRISRCFFGPIKRPPKNKDELLDDVDYYPNGYLNRLAHDGINALWLTIEFKNICKTSLTSIVDPDRDRRLDKLRKTVAKCRRYGIDVFIFCIEPRVMSPDNPLLKDHPEIGSKSFRGSSRLFCPFSVASQTYLYESVNDIFSEVPKLGGLINISFGERSTTCLSGADKNWNVACPICAKKKPGEILRSSLSAMERGMHAANPDAKLISWLYVPENGTGVQRSTEPLKEIAQLTPPGVICQYNFESGGTKIQLGKKRHAGDYWLSYIGPSRDFKNIVYGADKGDVEVAAKLQACNSFEVSTVPYVPVPSILYKKYHAMRKLGITTVMQCWYIGNMPSVMNRAAGSELPFMAGELSEKEFLLGLASRDWGAEHAQQIVNAWELFAKAYDKYPLTNAFQYYGPMHEGIVWPLHLKPAHKNLSPIWKLEYPPSGDRIGECFSETHKFEEVLELCKHMSDTWQKGLDIIHEIKPLFVNETERLHDITNAEALGIQFRSGYNILRFYDLRERLLYGSRKHQLNILAKIGNIVREEIDNSTKMIVLCEQNPFLGFQAEAEGYKYFPAKLRWRIGLLQELLRTELVEASQAVTAGKRPFAKQSGLAENLFSYECNKVADTFAPNWQDEKVWKTLPHAPSKSRIPLWSWQSAYDDNFLYLNVDCAPSKKWRAVAIEIPIEPTHIYPRRTFRANVHGKRDIRQGWLASDTSWDFVAPMIDGRQAFRLRIPFSSFRGEADPPRPMRIDIRVTFLSHDKKKQIVQTWATVTQQRLKPRLGYGSNYPDRMGWLVRQ
jgi:hypothetical protein